MKHVLIVLVFVALLLVLAWKAALASPYAYDEADYMHATRTGLLANYTDTPTMPIGEFLRTGLSRGKDKSQSSQLSELIRGSNDIVFYRHWHGPLYFYWLLAVSQLGLNEHEMRVFTLAFPMCSLIIIYFGCLWVLGGMQGMLAAILSSALFAWSVPAVRSTELAPHQAFVCCYLACLILLCKTVGTERRTYFYGAVVAAALSCCLLEVGFVAVATVMLCGYLERQSLRADTKFVARSLTTFFATVFVVWPGAILKLSFVKGYVFMAYLSLLRKAPWGTEGFVETWEKRIFSSPMEWILICAGLLLWVFARQMERERRVLYPFVIFGAMMLLVTIRVTTGTARYALPFQPALDVLAGGMVAAYVVRFCRASMAYGLVAALCLVLFGETWINLKEHPVEGDSRLTALLVYIRENQLENSRMWVPQGDLPTLHYYFPNSRLRGYTDEIPGPEALKDGQTDGLLYPELPFRFERTVPGAIR